MQLTKESAGLPQAVVAGHWGVVQWQAVSVQGGEAILDANRRQSL